MKTHFLFVVITVVATIVSKAQSPSFSPNHEIVMCGPNNVYFVCTFPSSPQNVLWDFGDGTQATELNPIHHYTLTGVFTVKLTLEKNGIKDSIIKEDFVTVYPSPESKFKVETPQLSNPRKRKFIFTGFSNSDSIISYSWKINDTLVANTADFIYVFPRADNFKISLTVENNKGCSHYTSDSITIKGNVLIEGINEVSIRNSCKIYLIPEERMLRMEVKNGITKPILFSLLDVTGKVLHKEYLDPSKKIWSFNIQNFKQGILIAEVQNENEIFARKVPNY